MPILEVRYDGEEEKTTVMNLFWGGVGPAVMGPLEDSIMGAQTDF